MNHVRMYYNTMQLLMMMTARACMMMEKACMYAASINLGGIFLLYGVTTAALHQTTAAAIFVYIVVETNIFV